VVGKQQGGMRQLLGLAKRWAAPQGLRAAGLAIIWAHEAPAKRVLVAYLPYTTRIPTFGQASAHVHHPTLPGVLIVAPYYPAFDNDLTVCCWWGQGVSVVACLCGV
jgi:hypothetical protein